MINKPAVKILQLIVILYLIALNSNRHTHRFVATCGEVNVYAFKVKSLCGVRGILRLCTLFIRNIFFVFVYHITWFLLQNYILNFVFCSKFTIFILQYQICYEQLYSDFCYKKYSLCGSVPVYYKKENQIIFRFKNIPMLTFTLCIRHLC